MKGFGLTLLLGIVASLFTALFVTKTIFGILIDHFGVNKLGSLPQTFPKWDRMLRPNVDWMSKAWIAYAFSGAFIVIGLIAFGAKWTQGQILDIEFASGTSVQFDLKQPMKIEEVARSSTKLAQEPRRARVREWFVGTDDRTYEVSRRAERNGVRGSLRGVGTGSDRAARAMSLDWADIEVAMVNRWRSRAKGRR